MTDNQNIKPYQLRVFHYPQIPCPSFEVDVKDLDEAVRVADMLVRYDLFQHEKKIKPDYCNSTIICRWEEWDGEWDWESVEEEELEAHGWTG